MEKFVYKTEKTGASFIVKKEVDLVPNTDPILKEIMPIFDFSKDNPIIIGNTLVESMQKFGGIGLSANQIGLRNRAFAMGVDEIVVYFNPELIESSTETEFGEEGCLSFPNLYIKIRRPKFIKVKYQDYTGKFHEKNFTGLTAKCFLHELDHLNGKTFVDVADPISLNMARKKLKKRDKKYG